MQPIWNESVMRTLGRWGVVFLVLFALLALSAMPLQFAHLGTIRPAFILMAVYYCAILQPFLLPPVGVFVLGLVLDLLCVYPLGLQALTFVVVQWLTHNQRKFLLGQPFLVIWAGFALMALGTGAVQWIFFALFNANFPPVKPVLMSVLMSTLLFPLVALVLSMVQRALTDDPASVA